MARRKTKRTRRKKSFKILNALESLTYLGIIMRGTTGGGIVGFFTGEGDLVQGAGTKYYDEALGVTSMVEGEWGGTGEISLKDLMMAPTEGVNQIVNNLSSNLLPMAVAGATTAITFNVGRRLLRKPINRINSDLMKPLLGAGIKL
jgi:hypothetical protein